MSKIFEQSDFYNLVKKETKKNTQKLKNNFKHKCFEDFFKNKILEQAKKGSYKLTLTNDNLSKEQKNILYSYFFKFNIDIYKDRVEINWLNPSVDLKNKFIKVINSDYCYTKEGEYYKVLDYDKSTKMVKVMSDKQEVFIHEKVFDIYNPIEIEYKYSNSGDLIPVSDYIGNLVCYFDWKDQIRFRNENNITVDTELYLFNHNEKCNSYYWLINEYKITTIYEDNVHNIIAYNK